MPTTIRISDELATEAKIFSKIEHISMSGQIEHWTMIGKCAEENPELTYEHIKEILTGMEELDNGERTEYQFGKCREKGDLKSFKGKVNLDIDLNILRDR
jgi:hypothetical protein